MAIEIIDRMRVKLKSEFYTTDKTCCQFMSNENWCSLLTGISASNDDTNKKKQKQKHK